MKFSCEKALLSAAVSVASRAVAAKSSIPAMEGILMEAGQTLRLTGYNCPKNARRRGGIHLPGLHGEYQMRPV